MDPAIIEERKKAILKESLLSNANDPVVKEILTSEEGIINFEISTGAEIHYNGKENIEGYASLVNSFLRSMMMTSKSPSIINIDNIDGKFDSDKVEDSTVFYDATIDFKDKFTTNLQKKVKGLKTINVRTNYQNIPDGISAKAANKLCQRTFSFLGLKNTINC